jgi:alpha-L-arabinofuranosidase
MTTAEYAADLTRRYSSFLNAPAEQKLVKVVTGPSANLPATAAYTETMTKNAVGLLGQPNFEALSLHYYTRPIRMGWAPRRLSAPQDSPRTNCRIFCVVPDGGRR